MKIYFIGIGGVSMSSLAKHMKEIGFAVAGSDLKQSNITKELQLLGVEVSIGSCLNHVKDSQVVVYTGAVKADNEELEYAKNNNMYILKRSELLRMITDTFDSNIGIAGCHGKTTSTCIVAHMLKTAKLRFTAHIGGFDNKYGNYYRSGGNIFLSEVCEYQKSIDDFNAKIAVVLNVGKDHLDSYSSYDELKNSYFSFLDRAETAIINLDDNVLKDYKGEKISFAIDAKADIMAKNLELVNGKYKFDVYKGEKKQGNVLLSVFGKHNVYNALASIAVGFNLNLPFSQIKRGLLAFKGVNRRFERIKRLNGMDIILDYAHHPDELKSAIKTMLSMNYNNIHLVFEPHTYSRTKNLMQEFTAVLKEAMDTKKVKSLTIYKTFPAREEYIEGGSGYDLHLQLKNSKYLSQIGLLVDDIKRNVIKNDAYLILGAGNLYFELKERL